MTHRGKPISRYQEWKRGYQRALLNTPPRHRKEVR